MTTNFIKKYWTIIVVLMTAGILRVFALLNTGDFTWDELFNFVYSQRSWADSIRIWQLETNPPLHLLILKLWWWLAPTTELWARLPSVFFGLAAIGVIYYWGKKMISHDAGLLAAIVATIATPHVYASVLARIYSALFFFTTLSLYYFYQIFIIERRERKILITYTIIQIFLLFSHLTAVEVLAGQFVALIILRAPIQKFWLWIKLNLLPILAWAAWVIPSLILKFSNPQIGQAWFLNMASGGTEIFDLAKVIFSSPWPKANVTALIIFAIVLILILGKNIQRRSAILPIYQYILTYLMIIFGTAVAYQLWNYKFFIVGLPALFILFAVIITQTKKWLAILLTIILLSLQLSGTVRWLQLLPICRWAGLNDLVAQLYNPQKKQTIVVAYFVDKLAFDRYYHGAMDAKFFIPFAPEKLEEQILKNNYNYLGYTFAPEFAQSWHDTAELSTQDEILLFEWDAPRAHLNPLLQKNGWQLKQTYSVSIPVEHSVFYYVKDKRDKK